MALWALLLFVLLVCPSVAFAADEASAPLSDAPMRLVTPEAPRLQVRDQLTLDKPVIFGIDNTGEAAPGESEAQTPAPGAAPHPTMQTPQHRGPVHRIQIETVGGERLTLQNQRRVTFGKSNLIFKTTTRTYEDVCTTPCDLEVAAGAYRLAVADADTWHRNRTLEVRRRVIIDADGLLLLSHRNRRGARAGFYSAMAASVLGGFAVAMVSAIEQRDKDRDLSPQRTPTMRALSVSLVGAGLGFFVGGVMSRDVYRVQHVQLPSESTPAE